MRRRTAVAVLVLLVSAGCGDDPESSAQVGSTSSTTPTTEATTTTAGPGTTQRAGTTTTVKPLTNPTTASPICAMSPVGAGATDVTTKAGDFDGNGTADVLRTYKLANDWHLRVELAAGAGGSDIVVPGIDPATGLKAIGGFNIGDKLADEAFAVVGSGASSTLIGIFVFANCTVTRVTENGNPASFSVGASVLNRSGVSCVAGTALQTLRGTAPPNTGTPFTVVRSTYDLVGSTLVFANSSQTTIASNDPALGASARFDCGPLSL